jgi:Fur family peroxide stress response transcriptional regulator
MIEMISNLKQIKDILKKVALRPTYQRIKILETLHRFRYKHPTVEMIFSALKDELPVISMTTVYNTLNSMVEKNLLRALTITGVDFHYDPDITTHHHFYCTKCHKIYDINVGCYLDYDKKKNIAGHKIDEVHGYFKGICENCLKNSKRQQERMKKVARKGK